ADGGAPDTVGAGDGTAELAEVFGLAAEVVVDEYAVRLAVREELLNDLLGLADVVGHVEPFRGEVAEAAAIVAAARGDHAGGGEERPAGQDVAARRRIIAVRAGVAAGVAWLERPGFHVG